MMAQRVRREGSEGAERSRGDLGICGQRGVLASARGLHSRSHQSLQYSMAAWSIALSTCAGSCMAGRWARGLVTNATPRLSSRQEVQLPHRVGRRQQGTGQAASRQLDGHAPRSLQLLGHLDSSHYYWH